MLIISTLPSYFLSNMFAVGTFRRWRNWPPSPIATPHPRTASSGRTRWPTLFARSRPRMTRSLMPCAVNWKPTTTSRWVQRPPPPTFQGSGPSHVVSVSQGDILLYHPQKFNYKGQIIKSHRLSRINYIKYWVRDGNLKWFEGGDLLQEILQRYQTNCCQLRCQKPEKTRKTYHDTQCSQ